MSNVAVLVDKLLQDLTDRSQVEGFEDRDKETVYQETREAWIAIVKSTLTDIYRGHHGAM